MTDDIIRTGTKRAMIIDALYTEYPNEMSDIAVQTMMQGMGYDVVKLEVRSHLQYLSGPGKEYIVLKKQSRELWLAQLTPRGKDLKAGAIQDPGVRFAR